MNARGSKLWKEYVDALVYGSKLLLVDRAMHRALIFDRRE